jgi:hypothetical protein
VRGRRARSREERGRRRRPRRGRSEPMALNPGRRWLRRAIEIMNRMAHAIAAGRAAGYASSAQTAFRHVSCWSFTFCNPCCSFPIQRNRDKISTRKAKVANMPHGSRADYRAAVYPHQRTSPDRPDWSVWCPTTDSCAAAKGAVIRSPRRRGRAAPVECLG